MKRTNLFSPTVVAAFALAACAGEPAPDHAATQQALTAAQCDYFATDGSVQICHYTGGPRKPYKILKVKERTCVRNHADHPEDYVAIGDPTCGGLGCLPDDAPCDATLDCCDGLTCQQGTCVPACVPTTCQAQGASCGQIPDGCGGTLDCGACECPCATQPGWGTTPITRCARSGNELQTFAIIDGELGETGGAYGVSEPGDGTVTCFVQFPTGAFSQHTTVSSAQHAVCKQQVEAVIASNQLASCEFIPPDPVCEPGTCETQGIWCGVGDDGCGGTLDCGPCIDCPCDFPVWGELEAASSCARSDSGLSSVAIYDRSPDEPDTTGGSFGVHEASDGSLSCFRQFPASATAQHILLSGGEHRTCRLEVNEMIRLSGLTTCRPYTAETGCVPDTCEAAGICGPMSDGCGNRLECTPCN